MFPLSNIRQTPSQQIQMLEGWFRLPALQPARPHPTTVGAKFRLQLDEIRALPEIAYA